MAQANFTNYSGAFAVTPSDTTLINCRAIYVGGAGNVTITAGPSGSAAVTFTAPPVGSIIPIMLDQGKINAATTATLLVALQ